MAVPALTTSSPNQSILFEQLCDKNEPIYLQNTLQESSIAKDVIGDLIIGFYDYRTHRNLTLGIPKNSIVCANDQVPTQILKESTDIRKYLRLNVLRVLSLQNYLELIERDPNIPKKAEKELSRLMANMTGESIVNAPKTKQLDTDDMNIRESVMNQMNKSQFEQDDEEILLSDFKALEPFSDVEKEWLRSQHSLVSGSYQDIKTYLTQL